MRAEGGFRAIFGGFRAENFFSQSAAAGLAQFLAAAQKGQAPTRRFKFLIDFTAQSG